MLSKKILVLSMIIAFMSSLCMPCAMAENKYDPFLGWDVSDNYDDYHTISTQFVHKSSSTIGLYKGAWLQFKNVDFTVAPERVTVEFATMEKDGYFELRIDSPTGELISTVNIDVTPNYSENVCVENKAMMLKKITGVHDLYLVFTVNGSARNIKFYAKPIGKLQTVSANKPFKDVLEKDKKTVEKITSIGLMRGDKNEKFSPKDNMTRGDFAIGIGKMLGMVENKNGYKGIYKDVLKDDYGANIIEEVGESGIMGELSQRRFGPSNPISINEAICALTQILGYKDAVAQKGVNRVALDLKILNNVLYNDLNENISRINGAMIFENVINAPVLKPIIYSDESISYERMQTEGILSLYLKIYKKSGLVNSNAISSLSNYATNLKYDEVMIDDVVYKYKNVNVSDFLGQKVEFYYEEKNDEKTILFANTKNENIVEEFSHRDISNVSYNKIQLEFQNSKTKTYNYDESTAIIYNGKSIGNIISLSDIIGKNSGFSGGVKWIDNNGDNIADTLIINDCKTIKVKSYSEYENKIYDEYGFNLNIDIDSPIDKFTSKTDLGEEFELSMLKSQDVITVYQSSDKSGFLYTEIIYSTKEITGTVTELKEDKAVIGDKEYYIAKQLQKSIDNKKTDGFKLQTQGVFKLDALGQIASFTYESVCNQAIVTSYHKKSGLSGEIELKLYTTYGEMKDYKISQKVTVDNKKLTSTEDVDKYFKSLLSNGKIPFLESLILYKTDKNGDINYIDTPNLDENSENATQFRRLNQGTERYKIIAQKMLSTKFVLNDPIIIKTPPLGSANIEDENLYQITTLSEFSKGKTYVYGECYTSDKSNVFVKTFVTRSVGTEAQNSSFLVDSVGKGITANGDSTTIVKGYYKNAFVTFKMGVDNSYNKKVTSQLTSGTILRPMFDSYGDLVDNINTSSDGCVIVLDKDKNWYSEINGIDINGEWAFRAIHGVATEYEDGFLSFKTVKSPIPEVIRAKSAAVYVYDRAENKYTVASLGDIVCENDFPNYGSEIYISMNLSVADTIVIFK